MPELPSTGSEALDATVGALLEHDAEDLYEHAPCGFLSTLPDGTIVKVNATLCRWTGYEAAELVGRRFQDLLTPGGKIYHETHYAPLLRMQGSVREIAVDVVCAGGARLPVLVNAVLRSDAEGTPLLVRTTVFDATERREYERELLRARERAERSEERARLLAQTLQASLIPPAPPAVPGLDVGAVYRPAGAGEEVGGDFYDVFEVAPGDWAVVIGDVCGKGPEAAAVTALARYTVRAAALREREPARVLATLNEALLRSTLDRFCTAAYARLLRDDDGATRLKLAAAGHPLPVLARAEGPAVPVGVPGSLLGVLDQPDLPAVDIELEPGDVMAFYTDGITEGRREREFFGEHRLRRVIGERRGQRAGAIARALVDEVVAFQAGFPRDDIAVVVLKAPAR